MAEPKYERLTRERAPRQLAAVVLTRSSLWLGGDHLLLVECTGYTEVYKRFYFRDIQAITIRETTVRATWNWLLGILFGLGALGLAVLVASDGWEIGATVFFCILFTVSGVPLILNNLFGATCACQIRTAVQTGDLPSLCRVRQARKLLDRIRPLIVAAQGRLTAGEVAARMQQTILSKNPTQPPAPAAPGSLPPVIS